MKESLNQLPFYRDLNEEPSTKYLNNINMFRELSFYDEFNFVRTSKAFKGYARSYSVEVTDSIKIHQLSQQLVDQALKICLNIYQLKLKALNIR